MSDHHIVQNENDSEHPLISINNNKNEDISWRDRARAKLNESNMKYKPIPPSKPKTIVTPSLNKLKNTMAKYRSDRINTNNTNKNNKKNKNKNNNNNKLDRKISVKSIQKQQLINNNNSKLSSSKKEQNEVKVNTNNENMTLPPLEMFDSLDEVDAFIPLPETLLKAYSPFFINGNWEWLPCEVISYSEETQRFEVKFNHSPDTIKYVKRLNLRFDDEDANEFQNRREQCHKRREQEMERRRYEALINAQPDDLVAPMQKERLKGIISLLNIKDKQRNLVNDLLTEVKNGYVKSMKKASIDSNYQTLPPNAVLDFYPTSILPAKKQLQQLHWTSITSTAEVLLSLFNSTYTHLNSTNNKLIISDESELNLPLTLYEFQDIQDENTAYMRDKVIAEWRSSTINDIRDRLASVFNLFATDSHQYDNTRFQHFVKVTGLMMRTQLCDIIEKSIDNFVDFMKGYSISSIDNESNDQLNKNRTLFKFKIATRDGAVTFLPSLDMIEISLCNIIDFPKKLMNVSDIDSEVAPLMGFPEISMIRPDSAPHIYKKLNEANQIIKEIIEENLEGPKKLAELYQKAQEEMESELSLKHLEDVIEQIETTSPSEVCFCLVTVDCNRVKNELIQKAKEIQQKLLKEMSLSAREENDMITKQFNEMMEATKVIPNNARELHELKESVKHIVEKGIPQLQTNIGKMQEKMYILDEFLFTVSIEDFNLSWNVVQFPRLLFNALKDTRKRIDEDSIKFKNELQLERHQLQKDLHLYREEVQVFVHYGSGTEAEMEEYANQVEVLRKKLSEAQEKVASFNERDDLFGEKKKEYKELSNLCKEFEPYYQLWHTTALFQSNYIRWMTGPFSDLDYAQIDDDIDKWFKLIRKLETILPVEPARVASEMKSKILEFKHYLPIIQWLRTPGLHERHWNQIGKLLNYDFKSNYFTLSQLLKLPIDKCAEQLEHICNSAEKEYALEVALENMRLEWKHIMMDIVSYKETGTYIVKGSEDIIVLLDDQIMKTQAMRGSPYITPFEQEAKQWESRLQMMSQIMEEWLMFQKTWLYLEPIFGSDDIMRQMPQEGRRFAVVDQYWKRTMDNAHKNSNALDFLETDALLKGFKECNKMLDLISKGLNDYLETKRLAFPRFYFLSNDELLNILSQTKNPTAVQEHLNKCFDAIHRLDFNENQIITAMNSIEGEKVHFVESIDPNAGAKKGNVEIWLKDVERIMRNSLKDVAIKARNDYIKQERTEWVLNQPGQIVLCVSQAEWTSSVTNALQTNGLIGLKKYGKLLDEQLNKLVELVRGELSTLNRITLGALTTIDVHARDVVNNMIELKVSDTNNFEWKKQLRYYWNDDNTLVIKMIQTTLNYGYEYLGNSSRLVITPLTDRAYATLMGAVHLHLGGAPEGPAGTGKTETVKDLAKALAIQCVVFNCSDGLDYLAMGKFFKGLASSGAWSCFDEFNRIQLEVLSVISQQISTIQRAIVEEKKSFFFENVQIPLIPTCSVFITMNPGYAGRSELPDNLKALFRTVAMMIPDYALIAEIILYSYGYNNARNLAQKIVSCLRLASEQLSSQDHYDFGMRNVKAILSAAGQLKQMDIHKSEELLCLEAINQCNLPKFTSADVPLFKGITQDLFPEANIERNISELQDQIKTKCIETNIQPTLNFLTKCTELYETICVRHGLMLVGSTYSAKSTCIKVLGEALGNVKIQYINPKSVTRGQLYGQFDINTHEWTDGVLPPCIRKSVSDTSNNKHWIVFDGPVDALWIEDMNTVLDDNKKLCLASGEIIKINNKMNFLFEVGDLSVASPATVSRCGMVYLEPSQLGWEAPVKSWLNNKPNDHIVILQELFQWLINPILTFINDYTQPMILLNNLTLVNNVCRILECIIKKDYDKIDLECQFVFAIIWSIGCTLNQNDRIKFSKFLRSLLSAQVNEWNIYSTESKGRELSLQFPEKGLVFDFIFNDEHREWYPWSSIAQKYEIPKNIKPHEIVIPTIDSIRHSWLLQKLWDNNCHVILTGSTGTGKSLTIKEKLLALDTEAYVTVMMSFSARTNANQTQDIIDNKLERRRQGILGPPLYKKCMIFIDDLNMPSKEEYGAQPPLELLRQWMNYGGWYDRQSNLFKQLVDIQFIGAMMDNNVLPTRLLRHFHHIGVTPYDADSLNLIFGSIMDWYMTSSMPNLLNTCDVLVKATIEMYTTIVKELLPTPTKSHYTFNLRDISKVFQGIINVNASTINDKSSLLRLWLHEMKRTFSDRLIDVKDQEWFEKSLKLNSEKYFNIYDSSSLCFSNLLNEKYSEVENIDSYKEHMLTALNDYNDAHKIQMNLVLFPEAVEHVTRIARIISQPYGHALLVGVGGSGKQSLTRLATHMTNYLIYEINVHNNYTFNDWRDDLRVLMRQTGLQKRKTVLLLSDAQMRNNNQFEDLNNILNNGEVPNLFPPDELIQLLDELKPLARKAGQDGSFSSIYSYFVDTCKEHIHIVLCLSPLHPQFRTRLRQFPSLVNCCTIDWFQPWSNDALISVAKRLLPEQKDDVINTCASMQNQVIELCEEYEERMGRHSYVTSKSYLEMLSLFKHLLNTVGVRTTTLKLKYENGLTKLEETEKQVVDMQAKLEQLQPQLIQSTKEAVELMNSIEKQSEEVEKTREIVSMEEKDCNEQALVAQSIRDDCETQLAEAIPILESALKALRVIRKQDIVELKSMKAPPSGVILTVQALCIMLGVPPVREGQVGKRKDNYWEAGKRSFLRDTHFIANLENYEKDNIPPERIAAIRPLLKSNDFVPQKIAKSSKACEGFCKWVRAMEVYDRVAKMIQPKREALSAAEGKLKEAEDQLNNKKNELATIQAKLDDLQAQFDKANKRKESLEQQVNECEQRLERAEKLIGGLSGEKDRWRDKATTLKEDHEHIIGYVLVSAGIIAYLGVFTQEYRQKCIKLWCKSLSINESFKLHNILSSKIELREWSIQGLPKDEFSYDNAVIMEQSQRYSLLIDPQGQATRWLKRRYSEKQFQVLKASDNQFSRQIQNAVQFGLTVLVEGIGEDIDSVLNPILLRQFTYDGRRKFVQLGGESIEFNSDFKMFLVTKLSNPHYTPETATKVTLINFMITCQALEDQMLNIVVSQVDSELERQRGELIVQNAENQKQLSNIEDKILNLLNDSKGMILDDIELIATLQKSKTASLSIEKRMSAAKKTEDRINKFRNEYQKVAILSARLFFCVVDLGKVDPMYQFSLRWYIQLFLLAIESADRHPKIKVHTNNIESTFTHLLYRNVCRSLFEEHKLLFSFMMTLAQFENSIQPKEFRFLLSGANSPQDDENNNISPNWLPKSMYRELINLVEDFDSNEDEWYKYYSSSDPINATYPGSDGQESEFHRLLILKILRPEKLMEGIQKYVGDLLGNQFVTPPPFNLELTFNDANQCSPLLFILSPGMDPSNDVYNLAQQCGQGHLESISLGQGQGPIAEQAIREAVGKGTWVLLENCHLAVSWLPILERIVDELQPETTNPQFRLWLTSKPTEQFPAALLQDCIKMTNEPPRGVKANLLRSLSSFKEAPSNIMYRLLLFHALVVERKQFGPLGWNIAYDFTEGDLNISKAQIDNSRVALEYLIGELNYGGRVTDFWDRRTLKYILKSCFDMENILGYKSDYDLETLKSSIEHDLPLNDHPSVFGMHQNAAITSAIESGKQLTDILLQLQPRDRVQSSDNDLLMLINDIKNRLPSNFDVNLARENFPIEYGNSMNTVLVQELERYNRLLSKIHDTLLRLESALTGEIVMDSSLELMAEFMIKGQIPQVWRSVSYPTRKKLMSWLVDLINRIKMFEQWLENGPPGVYWISGFFFPQGFLTGTLQNYARSKRIPIDEVVFSFEIMEHINSNAQSFEAPVEGCYIHGLYLQGAGFKNGQLQEENSGEMYTKMPVIWLKPIRSVDKNVENVYECPVYKTSARAGTLSTTGHSTNFILSVDLPMNDESNTAHWVRRGTAMLTMLDE